VQDALHYWPIDLALAQHKRPKVGAALPNIFAMLASRLPVGTAHHHA
jgi:hypothetical protein